MTLDLMPCVICGELKSDPWGFVDGLVCTRCAEERDREEED